MAIVKLIEDYGLCVKATYILVGWFGRRTGLLIPVLLVLHNPHPSNLHADKQSFGSGPIWPDRDPGSGVWKKQTSLDPTQTMSIYFSYIKKKYFLSLLAWIIDIYFFYTAFIIILRNNKKKQRNLCSIVMSFSGRVCCSLLPLFWAVRPIIS